MTANGLKTVVSTNRQTAGVYGWICSARTRLWTEAFGLLCPLVARSQAENAAVHRAVVGPLCLLHFGKVNF